MKKNIPNFITLLNLFCGIIAIIFINNVQLKLGFLFIVLGLVFDFFDGFVARLLKVTSPLGLQLDSLADVVTFGVAPSLILFQMMEQVFPQDWASNYYFHYCILLTSLFVALASAFRLAKFNIDTRQTVSFIGLPTPANALFIGALPFVFEAFQFTPSIWLLLSIIIISSYLLNSEIPLFALKFKSFAFSENKIKYLFLGTSLLIFIVFKIIAIPFIIILYIITSIFWKDL